MSKKRFTAIKTLLASAVAVSTVAPVQAEIFALEEIIVTAEKRSEDLQDTPITVYAFTNEALRDAGAHDLESLSSSVPSLHVSDQGNDYSIGLRGVSSFEAGERGDASVAFHVDGIYVARPYGAGAPFYDVERVEVLSGPQGTLYGRNATGGLVNVISQKPVDTFEASVDATVGDYGHVATEGMINIPVSDQLAVRGAFYQNKRDGYKDNGAVKDGDDIDDISGRIHLLYDPTDNLSLLLSADYTKKKGVGGVWSLRGTDAEEDKWNLDSQQDQDDEIWGLRWEANWDLDQVTLTYIGSHREANINWNNQDYDGTDLAGITPFNGYGVQETWTFKTDSEEETHELRLSSNSDGMLEWMLGAYYFKEEQNVEGIYLWSEPGWEEYWIWDYGMNTPGAAESESKALFGQASFHATDDLKFTLGLRRTTDEKQRVGDLKVTQNGVLASVDPTNNDGEWSKTNWKAGFDWNVTDSSMIYMTAGTGYKAGGYNDSDSSNNYDPEEIMAYELGTKNRFFDDRVQLNASVFMYDYDDIQVTQVEGNRTRTRNAGKADIKGLELSIIGLITENDKVDLNLGYLDSEYLDTTFREPFTDANIDISGNQLTKAPKLSYSLGLEHSWSFGDAGSLKARFQTAYRSETHLRVFNFSDEKQDDYFTSDLLLTYNSAEEDWYVQGYLRNMENNMVATSQAAATFGLLQSYTAPRTFGVKFGYKWL